MRFWDSSALVPLVVSEPTSAQMRTWVEDDADIVVWALTDVELRSALARLARDGRLSPEDLHDAAARADQMVEQLHVVECSPAVRNRAKRLLMIHHLRAADALQLAAALIACADDPGGFEFLTLDARLAAAARSEGFRVRP